MALIDIECCIGDSSDTKEYEDSFVLHLMREDYSSAAQSALEFSERITLEGRNLIGQVVQE